MPLENNSCERSLRPFSTTEKYLLAVREDLAEWLASLYPDCGINYESFFAKLETGVLLCKHINTLIDRLKETSSSLRYPSLLSLPATRHNIPCRTNVQPGTFQARDNICSCLRWCRAMKMKECLLFETDDLVLRKNEKSVVLCLMEVARIGAKLGLPMPTLIQFEKEIDADELRHATGNSNSNSNGNGSSTGTGDSTGTGTGTGTVAGTDYFSEDIDDVASSLSNESSSGGSSLAISSESLTSSILPSSLKNVDQVVTEQVRECRCQTTFPLIKVAPGKYRVGPSHLVIYVRILRNHVMVRVGGGWDTLEHFLEKHDPCRRRGCCNEPLRSASSSTGTSTVNTASSTSTVNTINTISTVNTGISQPPSDLPKVRRQKTDLTPLQVVFNRECPTTGISTSRSMQTSVLEKATPNPSMKRRVSQPQPQTKVELRRPNEETRAPRARSMDVGLLLDQFATAASPNASSSSITQIESTNKNSSKIQKNLGKFSHLPKFETENRRRNSAFFDSNFDAKKETKIPVKKQEFLIHRKRQSLMELEDIPSGRREKAVSDTRTDAHDHWDNAFNRHRQNFLRIKNIFSENEITETNSNPFSTNLNSFSKSKGKKIRHPENPNRQTGSAPSPDSATDEDTFSAKNRPRPQEDVSETKKRESVEEGFYSDSSCKSEQSSGRVI